MNTNFKKFRAFGFMFSTAEIQTLQPETHAVSLAQIEQNINRLDWKKEKRE